MLSVPAVVLILVWKSEDITIGDLNGGSVNYRNTLYIYIGIGILSAIYSIGMTSVGLSGIKLPPVMVMSSISHVLIQPMLYSILMTLIVQSIHSKLF